MHELRPQQVSRRFPRVTILGKDAMTKQRAESGLPRTQLELCERRVSNKTVGPTMPRDGTLAFELSVQDGLNVARVNSVDAPSTEDVLLESYTGPFD